MKRTFIVSEPDGSGRIETEVRADSSREIMKYAETLRSDGYRVLVRHVKPGIYIGKGSAK